MDEIRDAIKILSKYGYRSMSNVVGEYVERQVALMRGGTQAKHCQKGYDVMCESWGRIEVKSRNAIAGSMQCTLPDRKLESLDHFILVVVREGKIEKALLFDKDTLLSLKSKSGVTYINKKHFGYGKDITSILTSD